MHVDQYSSYTLFSQTSAIFVDEDESAEATVVADLLDIAAILSDMSVSRGTTCTILGRLR